jgi:hypothetical protein
MLLLKEEQWQMQSKYIDLTYSVVLSPSILTIRTTY